MATANLNDILRRLARGMDAEMLGEESDRQLVERALAERDAAALQAIVHRHGAMVYRVCWRVLQHTQDTEDAFQATFLVLAQKLRTVRKHASLASWLQGVAYRVSIKARLQATARRRREARASSSAMTPPDEVTWKELRASLDAELSRLPDKWRLPLVLCYLEGRTQEEAAKRLAWSKSTLRSRLEEARDALARRLTKRGITLPAALSAVLLSDCAASSAPAPELVARAVDAAAAVAAGKTLATAASATVAALTEGVIKAMFTTKLKMISVVLVAAAALVAIGIGTATFPALQARPTAQPDPDVESKSGQQAAAKDDPAAEKLVKQLGDSDFATREAAAKKLRAIGMKAIPALQAGTRDPSLEVSKRSQEVLAAVRADARNAFAKQFDPMKTDDYDHPLWKRFKSIAGNDQPARKLFAELIADPARLRLLDDAERDPDKAGDLYAAEVERFYANLEDLWRRRNQNPNLPERPWPDSVAIMYLGTYSQSAGKVPDKNYLEVHLFRTWPDELRTPAGPAIARVFVAWLALRDNPQTVRASIWKIGTAGIKEALPLLRKLVADENVVPASRAEAALILGMLGVRDDLASLRRVAESKLASEPFERFEVILKGREELEALSRRPFQLGGNVASPEEWQEARKRADIRKCDRTLADCAWAAAVWLAKGKPQEMDFLWAYTVEYKAPIEAGRFYHLSFHGFENATSRTAAHAKAKAFHDTQKNEPKEEPKPDPAVELVKQLGDPEFATREAATKKLRAIGMKAIPALKAGTRDPSPEVRRRSQELLTVVRADLRDALVKQFDAQKTDEYDHSVWKHFVAIAGDSQASRELFARIIANEKWLRTLDNAEADLPAAGHIYRVGIAEMFRDYHNDPAKSPPWPCDRPEEVAYLLLLGSHPDPNPPAKLTGDEVVPPNLRGTEALGRGIIFGEGQISHANGLTLGLEGKWLVWQRSPAVAGTDRVFAKLFAAWLAQRPASSEVLPRGFQIARRVPEILPLARRYAANDFDPKRDIPPLVTIKALELVAQLGTRADLPLFERHFGDETNVAAVDKPRNDGARDYFRPAPLTETTQMGDVALGLALLLHGANPEDFGFVVRKDTFKKKDGRYTIPWTTQLHLGFASDANRTAAFKKAKAWLVEHKPKVEPPAAPKPDPESEKVPK